MKKIRDIIKEHSRECNPFVFELSLNVPLELNLQWASVAWRFKLVWEWRTICFEHEYDTSINELDEFVDEVMDRLKLHPTTEQCIGEHFIW